MERLEIAGTSNSPHIILDPEKGNFTFSGRSLPEDPMDLFQPVLDWFENYKSNPLTGVNFEFKLTYFNTASSKVFFNLFTTIDQINQDHPEAENRILIYTTDDDDDQIELFEYYKELLTSNCLEVKNF